MFLKQRDVVCILYVDADSLKGILFSFGYMVLLNFSSFLSLLGNFRNSCISQNVLRKTTTGADICQLCSTLLCDI